MRKFYREYDVPLILFGLMLVGIGVILTMFYWSEESKCTTIHDLTGVPTHMGLSTGCLAKIDGKWMTGDTALSNTRDINVQAKP